MTWINRKRSREEDIYNSIVVDTKIDSIIKLHLVDAYNLDTGGVYALCADSTYEPPSGDVYNILASIHIYDRMLLTTCSLKECIRLFYHHANDREMQRFRMLLHHVHIVNPVKYDPLFDGAMSECTRRITLVDKLIFSTGMMYDVPTITSDALFVSRCKNRGCDLRAIILPPTRLSGNKSKLNSARLVRF